MPRRTCIVCGVPLSNMPAFYEHFERDHLQPKIICKIKNCAENLKYNKYFDSVKSYRKHLLIVHEINAPAKRPEELAYIRRCIKIAMNKLPDHIIKKFRDMDSKCVYYGDSDPQGGRRY